jgi:hypothetical protein
MLFEPRHVIREAKFLNNQLVNYKMLLLLRRQPSLKYTVRCWLLHCYPHFQKHTLEPWLKTALLKLFPSDKGSFELEIQRPNPSSSFIGSSVSV